MTEALDILCIGEPLYEFSEVPGSPERYLAQGFGGDTMNVAVAAARQGARTGVFTALGDDVFAERFERLWDEEGIDHSHVRRLPGQRTGLYFITYEGGTHQFSYARAGSAASLVTPDLIPGDLVRSTRLLQVSAISQAISASACDSVFHAMTLAREAGRTVCYDTNLRLKLWPLERARSTILGALRLSHIARPSIDDARLLTGLEDPRAICAALHGLGPELVVLTLGAEGCMISQAGNVTALPPLRVEAVDASGAGDTFTGAFLAAWLAGADAVAAARHANAAAALQTTRRGCVGSMPDRAAVEAFIQSREPQS